MCVVILVPRPPEIIIAPSETEVAEGSTIVMVCEASSRREPVITWQLNNADIDRQAVTVNAVIYAGS
mgnify:CR=1 FL=1